MESFSTSRLTSSSILGRLQALGYNLMSFVEASPETSTKMADIDGKRGDIASQDYKEAFASSLRRIYQLKNST
jgi:hypothetical protein